MDTVLGILGALLVLTVLVVAHELGHYWVGRLLKFKIVEFAVGMGPKLIKWTKNGILYSIRALPIGGFTKFYGEDEDLPDAKAFNRQPVRRRAAVIAAGPVLNILFAMLLSIIILCSFGDLTPFIKTVDTDSPAHTAGLEAGDKVVSINGQKIDFYMEIQDYQLYGFGKAVSFEVERSGELITIDNIPTFYDQALKKNRIGIQFDYQPRSFGFFEALGLSFKWMYVTIKQMLVFLINLIFAGKGASLVMGPVGTIGIIGTAVTRSFEMVLQIGALLSINLAIINLLPFPALDGGRLVFLGIEAIRKKPLPGNLEGYINLAGFVVLMLLIGLLTYQDIARMVTT